MWIRSGSTRPEAQGLGGLLFSSPTKTAQADFDAQGLYSKLSSRQYFTGPGGRCFRPFAARSTTAKALGNPRNVKWGALCWIRDKVVPLLADGALDRAWKVCVQHPPGTKARNAAVDKFFEKTFEIPEMARALAHLDLLTAVCTAKKKSPLNQRSQSKLFFFTHVREVLFFFSVYRRPPGLGLPDGTMC